MTKKSLTSLLIIALFIVTVSSPVYATLRIDINGNISQTTPTVLGDNEEQKPEENNQEDQKVEDKQSESKQTEQKKESENKQQEQKQEAEKKQTEIVREQLKKVYEQEKKIKETNREIVKKIEEKAKEDKQKNIERIKLSNKKGLEVSMASKSGELDKSEETDVEMETEHGLVSFKNSKDGGLDINQGGVSAQTDLPLNIDPKTKTVSIDNNGDSLELKTLPEDALKSISNGQVLDSSPSGTPDKLQIAVENGKLIYKINDNKSEKMFGLFSISIPKEVTLSGDTGQVLEIKQSVLSKILDFLSI